MNNRILRVLTAQSILLSIFILSVSPQSANSTTSQLPLYKTATEKTALTNVTLINASVGPSKPGDAVDAGAEVLSHSEMLMFEGAKSLSVDFDTDYSAKALEAVRTVPVESETITNLLKQMKNRGVTLEPTLFIMSLFAANVTTKTKNRTSKLLLIMPAGNPARQRDGHTNRRRKRQPRRQLAEFAFGIASVRKMRTFSA